MMLMQRCCAKLLHDLLLILLTYDYLLTSPPCFMFFITRFRLVLSVYINITEEDIDLRVIFRFCNIDAGLEKCGQKTAFWTKSMILDKQKLAFWTT